MNTSLPARWIACAAIFLSLPPLLCASLPIHQAEMKAQVQVLKHGKEIVLALRDFEEKFGAFPSEKTRKNVEEATGKKLPIGDASSNAMLSQLIAADIIQNESAFLARIPGVKPAEENKRGGNGLGKGANAFAYIAGLDPNNPELPILVCPLNQGTTTFDPVPFAGKAAICWLDGSVQLLKIEEDGRVLKDGVDLMSPKHPVWNGRGPDIRYPDLLALTKDDPKPPSEIDEFLFAIMQHTEMGELTEQEKTKLAEKRVRFDKLAVASYSPAGRQIFEEAILQELPLCFEGARRQQLLDGLTKMLKSIQQEAKSMMARMGILNIAMVLDMYKLNCGAYPTREQGLLALAEKPRLDPVPNRWVRVMDKLPKDAWGNDYVYRMPGKKDPAKPDVFSKGPDGKEGTKDDISREDDAAKDSGQ